MDSEKYLKHLNKINEGRSPTDEGPYYHHAWWEAYKGSIKGKLGGVVTGIIVGAVVGGAVAAGVLAFSAATLATAALVVGGFAAAGGMYGSHEFSEIGKVVGASSAAQEQAELRMKVFEDGKFSELKQEIAELKSIVKGETPAAKTATPDVPPYRTTHYAKIDAPRGNRFVFWKIALIGLAVGVGVGALLATTGLSAEALHLLGSGGTKLAASLGAEGLTTASMVAMGALGASFGINRDVFRKIFDVTDLWTKGIISRKNVREQQVATGLQIMTGKNKGKESDVNTTILYEGHIDYPTSSTYHRDRVLAAAEKALLSFDHTRATPQ